MGFLHQVFYRIINELHKGKKNDSLENPKYGRGKHSNKNNTKTKKKQK